VKTFISVRGFADGREVSFDSLRHREYHHVFPDALLQEIGQQLTWR
jgi:hypothetical protein